MKLKKLEKTAGREELLGHFLENVVESGMELYNHQEEAILEVFAGHNVIVNTPTGSGKSLVALAHHYKSLCLGRISYYTTPIKALANEKFLSLCKTFGANNVGMITGDATINPEAPIICCTAEILANKALREGARAQMDDVILDEFHYYSDAERGISWQIPLLTLPQARFTIMSATMGNLEFFQTRLEELTSEKTCIIESEQRPIPLNFEYSLIPLTEKVQELVETNKSPIYLVHFSHRSATNSCQNLMSSNFCTKAEKETLSKALKEADFKSPYGKEIKKFLSHGIGLHHAGLLPKYRILVEKLTKQGLLKVICGTDTLGVGVNVPIRSVLFTQLFKYDGSKVTLLSVREFKQISGRAGRRGFDEVGYVVAQAPEHQIENIRKEAKLAASKRKKKLVKKSPPEKAFVNWNEDTFKRLQSSSPEPLESSFRIKPNLILNILSRNFEDGCASLKKLLRDCHEKGSSKRKLASQSRKIFISLLRGNILTLIPREERDQSDVKVKLNMELQQDFAMNQDLVLFMLDTIAEMKFDSPTYALNALSIIESIIENPMAILKAQINKEKSELMAELKTEGVGYEERMEQLEEVEYPKPAKEFIYNSYNAFREKNPWIRALGVQPKSIAREMFEGFMDFEDYIKEYKLERSEAVLLRHLSEVYKVLSQSVPPSLKNDTLKEAESYFRDRVNSIDSSLIDEWELLQNPNDLLEKEPLKNHQVEKPISQRKIELRKQIYKRSLDSLKLLAHDQLEPFLAHFLHQDVNGEPWTLERIDPQIDYYFKSHQIIRIDPDARNKKHTVIKEDFSVNQWHVTQIVCDTNEKNDWAITFLVDLEQSDREQQPVLILESFGPLA